MKRSITGQEILIWLVVATVVGIVCLVLCRAGKMKKRKAVLITLLGFYLAVIFTFTLGGRVPKLEHSYNLKLFWTINAIRDGKRDLIQEVIHNVVLFIPLGLILTALLNQNEMVKDHDSKGKGIWLPVLIGAGVSAIVEIVQLAWKIGLFEFDDIIYNTTGCLIGALAVLVIRRIQNIH